MAFFLGLGHIRGQQNSEGRLQQLYQWLTGWASLFRSEKSGHGATHTVRTEITVQRESTTVRVAGAGVAFDVCPLCGQRMAPAQAAQARLHLLEGSTAQDDLRADGASP